MTEDLAARLLAAIDAKESKARAAATHAPGPWRVDPDDNDAMLPTGVWVEDAADTGVAVVRGNYRAEFLVDNQPDTVLRRCAADRKILAEHQPDGTAYGDQLCRRCTLGDEASDKLHRWFIWPCPTLRALAEGYGITEETT